MDPVSLLLPLLVVACGVIALRRRRKIRAAAPEEAGSELLPVVKVPPTPNGDALDRARDAILGHIWTVIAGLKKKSEIDPPNEEDWMLLSAAVLKYATAIKLKPRDIPVIIVATSNTVALLERESENNLREPSEIAALAEFAFFLGSATGPHNAELQKLQGHAMSPDAAKQALAFIGSLQWEPAQKAFVPRTLH